MTTTLFAIFAIAVVVTLAWVITRIVNIFVELEGLHQQAKDFSERMDNHCAKVNKLKEDIKQIELTQSLLVERIGLIDEMMAKAAEGELKTSKCLELMRAIIDTQSDKMNNIVGMLTELQKAQQALIKIRSIEKLVKKQNNGNN